MRGDRGHGGLPCGTRYLSAESTGASASAGPDVLPRDVELRLVDPARNRFRVYGVTADRTLFGELCLVIAWGRVGRPLRRRTEVFADEGVRDRRLRELLARRRRHGYVEVAVAPAVKGGAS